MKVEDSKKIGLIEELLKMSDLKAKKEHGVREEAVNKNVDKVELSNRAEVKKIMEMVKKIPDVREDKVENLKEAIEAKTYNVKGELVARNLLKNHILEIIL